jgi:hypothetical protein
MLIAMVDNSNVVPDLSPHTATSQRFVIPPWDVIPGIKMYLCACIVTMHKAVKCLGNANENLMLLLTYQASAAHRLQQMIMDARGPQLVFQVIEAASMFLCTQIQQSAYGTWRTHLRGAKALMTHWQHTCSTRLDLPMGVISMVDVFGTTMAPSKILSRDTVAEHTQYLQLLGRLDADLLDTFIPIPVEVLEAIISINIHRVATLDFGPPNDLCYANIPSLTATLASLQQFDADQWADRLPSEYANQSANWALLATCYQSASILYLFQSYKLATKSVLQGADLDHIRVVIYRTLITSIMKLFEQRMHGGTHYKFMLWPIVICGIESAARGQHWDLKSLCWVLEATTLDLGTLAMREAAAFLEVVWDYCEKRQGQSTDYMVLDWDTIFERAPLFLM